MTTVGKSPAIPVDLLVEMQEQAERAAKGVRDPEDMRRAFERMDRVREMMQETNIAVELVRAARDPG